MTTKGCASAQYASKISALARLYLPYSALALTQKACLTITYQYFNFGFYYCVLATIPKSVATPGYTTYLFVQSGLKDYSTTQGSTTVT